MHDGHKWHDHKYARYAGSIESAIIHDPISSYTEFRVYVKCMHICNYKFRLYLLYKFIANVKKSEIFLSLKDYFK